MDLHIITLNIPWPPDYGGMIDSFYRILWLHRLGIRIHLHCFEYGRRHSERLEELCETVRYYPRRTGLMKQLSCKPYLVRSRDSRDLPRELEKDDFPILFDGLHTTFCFGHLALRGRMKLVRAHNIEHSYYRSLAANENNPFIRAFYLIESAKLKRYEKILSRADHVLALTADDDHYFNKKYGNSVLVPPFHQYSEVKSLTGKGDYVIYHGDLSVDGNARIAASLISDVFSRLPYSFVIAGKDPPGNLISTASKYRNVAMIANPEEDHIQELISGAQIHILPAWSSTGFKMKLLPALFAGRHCIVNSLASVNSMVPELLIVADSAGEMTSAIDQLMNKPFTGEMLVERKRILSENFDNLKNAAMLKSLLSDLSPAP